MKKINRKLANSIWVIILLGASMALFNSCADYMQGTLFRVSDETMIDEYIEQKDTSMTEFLKIADVAGFRGLLHAYGTNTCFIPTNDAISAYCQKQGIASMETLPVSDLENFMKFHTVRDTIRTGQFVSGRLATPTMLGKYLTTKKVQEGNLIVYKVNRQANIIKTDTRVANGIIQKIDYVLTPNSKTVGEMIQQLPDSFSLYKSVMLETGVLDTLINNTNVWYTAFLQSNNSFATKGITNRADLIAAMKIAQPDYTGDEAKLLQIFAQYHCIKRLAYITDLSISSAELTLATNQVITFKTSKDSLILNEYQSLTTFEKGITANKSSEWTDLSCSNGVLIDLDGYIQPVKRGPAAVYWEMTDQPEIKKMKEYRKKGSYVVFKPGDLSELNFGGKNSPTITYNVASAFDSKTQYSHYDYFEIPMRPTVIQWMEIKTPVLTEGTYNVWICWRRGGDNNKFKTTFKQDGKVDQVLPNVFDLGEYFNTSNTPEVNLNVGMKRYNAKQLNSVCCSRNCGAIKVEYTGRHILRMDALSGSSQAAWWDMIQFIPVDQNQLWPRFDVEGNAIYPGTSCDQIAPKDQSCSGDLNN